jgi:hypothetical protein
VRHCRRIPAQLNPESPGLKRLVEIVRQCKLVELIALRDFGIEDASLEPGERFPCDHTMVAELIKAGLAERLVDPS